MRPGRKRKIGVARTPSGQISRAGRQQIITIHPETMAARERELLRDGIVIRFQRVQGTAVIDDRTARDRLSGFTLGRLVLLERQRNGSGISQDQFNAGEAYCRLVRARSLLIDDSAAMAIKPQSLQLQSKGQGSMPDPESVAKTRDRWSSCEYELGEVCKVYGFEVRQAVSGICLENWPVSAVSPQVLNSLRMGLDAIGRAMR